MLDDAAPQILAATDDGFRLTLRRDPYLPGPRPDSFAFVVRTADGRDLGSVTEVLHTAAGELLSVRADDGPEVLVPFVSAIVTTVSLADGVIEIDPPEGLLDLD